MGETRVELKAGEKRRRPWFRAALRDALWGTLGGTLTVVPVMLWLHEGDGRALSFGLATGLGGFAGKVVRALLDSRRTNPPDSVRVSRDWLVHTAQDAADRHVHRRQVAHARRTATTIELRDGWDDLIVTLTGPRGLDEASEALAEHGWPAPERVEARVAGV